MTNPDLPWLVAAPGLTRVSGGYVWNVDGQFRTSGLTDDVELTDEDRAGIAEDDFFERTHDANN